MGLLILRIFGSQIVRAESLCEQIAEDKGSDTVHNDPGPVNDGRIVPPADQDLLFGKGEEIRCILFFVNGRCRFDCTSEQDRHTIADAAVDASVMIGPGDDLFIPDGKAVIGLASLHIRERETGAELHPLDSRNAEQGI